MAPVEPARAAAVAVVATVGVVLAALVVTTFKSKSKKKSEGKFWYMCIIFDSCYLSSWPDARLNIEMSLTAKVKVVLQIWYYMYCTVVTYLSHTFSGLSST